MRSFFRWTAVGLGLLSACAASAFSLSPAIFDLQIDPGGTSLQTLTLTNDDAVDQTFYVSIQRFIPQGELGQEQFLPPSETAGLPSWIYFSQPSIALKAGESRAVPFMVRVPSDAKPGGYYAAVFFSTQPNGGGAVAFRARVGALVLLRVNGPAVESLQVLDFRLDGPASVAHLPVDFDLRLQNTGSIHEIPQGEVTVQNFFGQTVAKVPVNPDQVRALPDSTRLFPMAWQNRQPSDGTGFWHEVAEEWNNFALGPYTATLMLRGPGITGVTIPSVHVSVWPWHLLVVLTGIIVILLILLAAYKRWILQRAVAKP